MSEKSVLATRLKLIREKAGLTQVQMAEMLGVSRGSIGYYENGERIPDALFIDRLSMELGISFEYIMGRSDNLSSGNVDIGLITGLSDAAIEKFVEKLRDKIIVSKIIEHDDFDEFIEILEDQAGIMRRTYPIDFGDRRIEQEYGLFLASRLLMAIITDVCYNYVDEETEERRTEFREYRRQNNLRKHEERRVFFEKLKAEEDADEKDATKAAYESYRYSLGFLARQKLHGKQYPQEDAPHAQHNETPD